MTRAEAFSEREVAMCTVARLVEDGRTYWAAGGGTPLYAVLLGKKLYAPDAQYVTEDGVIAPEPLLPFEPMMTMVASRAVHNALAWGTMNSAGVHAQLGHMDYGVLNTLQVDQHANGAAPCPGKRTHKLGAVDMVLRRAVGKIETNNVQAGFHQPVECLGIRTGGAQRGNDFGSANHGGCGV